MGQTVQFFNKDAAISAFENRGVNAWSIFQGKEFLFKGYGVDELDQILTALADGGTSAIYTLRVYENVEDMSMVKSKTDHDGSFNFRLNVLDNSTRPKSDSDYFLDRRIKGIEDRLDEILDKGEESDVIEVQEKNSIVGEILGNPAIAALVPVLLEKVINWLDKSGQKAKSLPAQTSVNGDGINRVGVLNGVPLDSGIMETVDGLKKHDPDFEKHLKMLLRLAEDNPSFFKVIIMNLENFNQ